MLEMIMDFWQNTGFVHIIWQQWLMMAIACLLIYLAIKKEYEPLLLLPIAFGMLLANLPLGGLMVGPTTVNGQLQPGGLLYYLCQGVKLGIYPPLIFLGIGAMTDFGPLLANPRSLLLGAAAQLGIFIALLGALLLGMDPKAAASVGIIGGADGPTAIFLTSRLKPELLGPIAIAAYSYMALIPIIQPPIMKLLTTEEERRVVMEQLRPVTKTEKILFPIVVTIIGALIVPSAATSGTLMFGNLLREAGVVERLAKTSQMSQSILSPSSLDSLWGLPPMRRSFSPARH